MIKAAGIDILAIQRFRKLTNEPAFINNVFTKKEIDRASTHYRRDRFHSVLFTLKEAILKALRCGLSHGSLWHNIEIDSDFNPTISGSLFRLSTARPARLHVSSACAREYALSIALAEIEE